MQAQETDRSGDPGEPNAIPYPESCGTRLWGPSEAGREPDRPGHWAGQGEGQGWFAESGLQCGSILRVGRGISAPSTSGEQKGPIGLPEGGPNGSSDRCYKMNNRFFSRTFVLNSTQRNSNS